MSKQRTYANFGEYLYWSYANLQMLHYALNAGKAKYDRMCYMIRSKAFKAYREGRWNIHDLLEFNVEKIRQNNYCWYCGKEMAPSKLTKDHICNELEKRVSAHVVTFFRQLKDSNGKYFQ